MNSESETFLDLIKKKYDMKILLEFDDDIQLNSFAVRIEENLFYEKKDSFIELLQFFLETPDSKTADYFKNMFQRFYSSQSNEVENFRVETVRNMDEEKIIKIFSFKKLDFNFCLHSERDEFAEIMS